MGARDLIGDVKKEHAAKLQAARDLIAECIGPIPDERNENVLAHDLATLQHRTNRLLAAILEKMHEK